MGQMFRDELRYYATQHEEDSRAIYRTGQRYERAQMVKDFDTMTECEKTLQQIAERNPLIWIAPICAKGQNSIRVLHGLPEVV